MKFGLKVKIGAVVLAFLLITTLVGGAMSWKPVEEGEVDVVKKWGDATGEVNTPGGNWITPFAESTKSISTRQQAYAMKSGSKKGEKDYSDPVSVKTRDGVNVDFDVVVRYRLAGDKEDAVALYSDYKTLDNAQERMIRPTVKRQFIVTAGSMNTSDVYTTEGQQELTNVTRQALEDKFSETGLVLDSVQITNYQMPNSYNEAVTEKEVAYQNELKAEAQVEVARQEARSRVTRAEGQAEANRVVAESLKNNPELIKIRYIEALKENGNTVYVGAGSSGGITLTKELDETSG